MPKVIFHLFVMLAHFSETISLKSKTKWEQNDWIGQYYNPNNGWIFHPIHLWQFTTDELSKDQWIYDTNLKWIYTGKTIYPYVFSNSLNRWLLFNSNDTAQESYFDFDQKVVRSVSFIEEMIDTPFTTWVQGTNATHYIDNCSGIVLTTFQNDRILESMLPNFRGLNYQDLPFKEENFKKWEVEYFCEPDWVLSYYYAGEGSVAYLNELNWEKEVIFSNDTFSMKYHHKPAFGHVYIQKSFPFELDITFTIKFGSNKVVTDFVLNPLKEIQYDLNFIAQDAAYMWFPQNDQSTVSGLTASANHSNYGHDVIISTKEQLLAATYTLKYGVFSGYRTAPPPDATEIFAGIAGNYLLVPTYIPIGYQLMPDDKGYDFLSLIEQVQNNSFSNDLINRFIAYRLKCLGQIEFSLEMIMGRFENELNLLSQIKKAEIQ
jgi:hypothetical protein